MDSLAVKPVPIRLYSYDYDGELKVRGIPRAEPAEVIRLLFEPEGVSPSDLAKWKVDHANIVKLPWLKAQLDLHGGDNPTSLTKDECLKRLRDRALRPDQCLEYEESIKTGRHQQEFHDLATLEEKLNYDADMFMEVYFGSRDTLLEPVPFMGVNFDVVLEAVSRVPGLKARNVGRDYHKMLWIGWDELLVRNACDRYMDVARINLEARRKIQRKYHADLAKRRKEKQQEKGEEHEDRRLTILRDRLKQHHAYMRNPGRKVGIEGSYIVDVTDHDFLLSFYSQSRKWVDIRSTSTPGVYEATFDIQPMGQGVMLLSKSMETLSDHAEECDAFRAAGVGDDMSMFHAFQVGYRLGMKRKIQEVEDYGALQHSREFNGGEIPADFSRYHMRWRGIEMKLKGCWLRDKEGRTEERRGWVEFKRDSLGQFIVDFGVDTVKGEVHAYKVDDQPLSPKGDWASLQEVASLPLGFL